MKAEYCNVRMEKVTVRGIRCEYTMLHLDPESVPKGKFHYEIGGDDESGMEPARIKRSILVNFYGSLVCDEELPLGTDGVLWLETGDIVEG